MVNKLWTSNTGSNADAERRFQTHEQVTQHVAVEKVLSEVKRIGGSKFHEIAEGFENDTHS